LPLRRWQRKTDIFGLHHIETKAKSIPINQI